MALCASAVRAQNAVDWTHCDAVCLCTHLCTRTWQLPSVACMVAGAVLRPLQFLFQTAGMSDRGSSHCDALESSPDGPFLQTAVHGAGR
jgi:hypothetical protein